MPEFLTRRQAGAWLQKNFGVSSHHALAKAGRQGPPYKICGRNALYRPEDLQRWIEARMQDPRAFARGRPRNLPSQKRAAGGAVGAAVSAPQPIASAAQPTHDETLEKAFAVLRELNLNI